MDERERQKLIQRLKTAKTSEERDEILWYLAGQDKTVRGKPQRAEATGAGKRSPWALARRDKTVGEKTERGGETGTSQPTPAKTEGTQIRLPVGKLGGFGSITALLFLFYGVVAIASAVMKVMQGQMDGDEIRQLIMGGLFLLFGVVIYVRAGADSERPRAQQAQYLDETSEIASVASLLRNDIATQSLKGEGAYKVVISQAAPAISA